MDFQSKGRPLTAPGLLAACSSLGVAAPAVWAVLAVETSAFGFFADRRPQILFERHVFHARTKGRFDATNPDLSNALPGGYAHGVAEYPRLEVALTLDHDAALQSTSWGIGQVMGFNFAGAGFGSVDEFVTAMVRDEDTQLLAMSRFIAAKGLDKALHDRNWASFARGYNGKDFKKNDYDTRLAAAFAKYSVAQPDLSVRFVPMAKRRTRAPRPKHTFDARPDTTDFRDRKSR